MARQWPASIFNVFPLNSDIISLRLKTMERLSGSCSLESLILSLISLPQNLFRFQVKILSYSFLKKKKRPNPDNASN